MYHTVEDQSSGKINWNAKDSDVDFPEHQYLQMILLIKNKKVMMSNKITTVTAFTIAGTRECGKSIE